MTCYINLGQFSVIKLYLLKADNSTANSVIEYISVLITLCLIIAVMLAHIWSESKWFKCTPHERQDEDDQNNLVHHPPEIDNNPVQPTYSVIDGPRPLEKAQELKDPVSKSSIQHCPKDAEDDTNESEDDDVYSTSLESLSTPLIKRHNN